MQKFVELLEKYVQWLALAAGGAYLAYMLWGYVLTSPVTTKVGNHAQVTLKDIDRITADEAATPLQRQMNATNQIDFAVPDFDAEFKEVLARNGQQPVTLAHMWTGSNAVPANPQQGNTSSPEAVPAVPGIGTKVAAAIPTVGQLPAPKYMDKSQGHSTVQYPDAKAAPTAAPGAAGVTGAAPGATAAAPVATGGPTPAPPAGRGAGALASQVKQQQQAGTERDVQWVSLRYRVAMQPMAQAFEAAGIPPQLAARTNFLSVELVREERDQQGNWTNPTVVPPLATQTWNALPQANDLAGEIAYQAWAERHQADIVQAAFYAVVKADPWRMPGTQVQAAPNAAAAAAAAQQRQAETQEMELTSETRFSNIARRYFNRPSAGAAPSAAARGSSSATAVLPAPAPGAAGNAPSGLFDPNSQPDVVLLVHDDSPEPGKTYHYRVRYSIRNPVFQRPDLCKNPADANVFAVWSDYSDWSDPVRIPYVTNFFVKNQMFKSDEVQFDIYKWEGGETRATVDRVAPGDEIGKKQPSADFSTGWTLVSVLPSDDDVQVVVMDPDGTARIRSRSQDSPEHQRLQSEAGKSSPPKPAPISAAPQAYGGTFGPGR